MAHPPRQMVGLATDATCSTSSPHLEGSLVIGDDWNFSFLRLVVVVKGCFRENDFSATSVSDHEIVKVGNTGIIFAYFVVGTTEINFTKEPLFLEWSLSKGATVN